MIEVPLLQQPLGSNSCLPTAVRAVLLWHGRQVSPDRVSEWCQETGDGCILDEAITSLGDEVDVEELPQYDEETLRAVVQDEEDPQPVIVTLKDPVRNSPMDHAVVVLGIQQNAEDRQEVVFFMDPLTGTVEGSVSSFFWRYWVTAGGRAFILRP